MKLEVTNLEELKELIKKASDSLIKARNNMYTLDKTIKEINRWQPEYSEKEKEKDKIQLLDEYMKSLDERLFVEEDFNSIQLRFLDKYDAKWNLGYIYTQTGCFYTTKKGFVPEDTFDELIKYKYAFKGKYDELFKEEE